MRYRTVKASWYEGCQYIYTTQGIVWFGYPWQWTGSGYVTYDTHTGNVVKILDDRALNRGKA